MDKKVIIDGKAKTANLRDEMRAAMESMQEIAQLSDVDTHNSSQRVSSHVPPRMVSGFMDVGADSYTCPSMYTGVVEKQGGVATHHHMNVAGKEIQQYKLPVDADEPVIFACRGEGIVSASLYVGGTLLSTAAPSTEVVAPDGSIMYMLEFLSKPLRGELIHGRMQIMVEFMVDGFDLPTLALLYADVPRVAHVGGVYEETVMTSGDNGQVEMIIVYTPGVVGFRYPAGITTTDNTDKK